jgi:glyoxylate reductase
VLTDTTADFAFTLLVSAARRVVEGADYVRGGNWKTWGPKLLTGVDIYGATLGLVGFGRIGQAMAKRASGFDMRVLYHDHDLNASTRHMFNDDTFSKMKPAAILVNSARGPIVDPDALFRALVEGKIRAAALDVTEPEPIRMDSPLLDLPNCLIVPHIASATIATRGKMAEIAAKNLIAGIKGEPLPSPVNPEVFEKGLRK